MSFSKESPRVNVIRETFVICALFTYVCYLCIVAYVCFPFLHWVKSCSGCFRQVFFRLRDKKGD